MQHPQNLLLIVSNCHNTHYLRNNEKYSWKRIHSCQTNTDTSNHNQTSLSCAVIMRRWRQKILSRLWSNHADFCFWKQQDRNHLFVSVAPTTACEQERWRCLSVCTATDLTCELVVTGRRGDAEVRRRKLSYKYGGWVDSEDPRVACSWDRDR